MRSLWWHSWTLSALAAAPVIDIIRRDPAFMLANEFGPLQLLLLLVVLTVAAPLPLMSVAWMLRSSSSGWPTLVLAPPAFAIGLYFGDRLGLELGGLLPAAVFAGLICWSYARKVAVRRYMGWLALVALLAPLHLLFDSSVRRATSPTEFKAATRVGGESRPPVVVLLLDELPTATLLDAKGAIDQRRFPSLASLADQAHWFPNFRSTDPATGRAVPALLAGKIPPPGSLAIARDLPDNLFTLLAPHYRISASESGSRLCPADLNSLVRGSRLLGAGSWLIDVGVVALHLWTPQPLAGRLLPPIERSWQRFPDRQAGQVLPARRSIWQRLMAGAREAAHKDRVTKFRDSIKAIDERSSAVLYFAHVMLPHRPWIYLPAGEGYLADGFREMKDFGRDRWPEQAAVANRAYQRHLLQAEFTDRLVGELLDRLHTLDIFDQAVIVVTADHGISFRPGERVRRLSPTNTEDLLRVPLLLKLPGQTEAQVHGEARSSLDFLPTLLELAGVAPPTTLTGKSLLEPGVDPFGPVATSTGLEYRQSVFGPLETPEDLFSFGSYADWIGFSEIENQLERHMEARVSLLGQGAQVHREDSAPAIPAWVFGWIESAFDLGGFGIAVAVDGLVEATGECQRVEGHNRFNVLLPPWSLPPGDHRVEVLLIEPGGRIAWRLPPA